MATIAVEYGVNEEDALYLPCRDSELEEVLRAVNAGSSNEITIINVMWPEGLRMLNGLTVDADEMNFLAKRMDSFVPMELMKFIAAASVINDMDTCKLINVEPNRPPFVSEVPDDLRSLQRAVGGRIEPISLGDNILLVGNKESKLMGLEGNRRIGSSIIAGPFFLVGENGEDFRSLTDAETRLCMERFSKPEQISQLEVQEDMGFTMGFFN